MAATVRSVMSSGGVGGESMMVRPWLVTGAYAWMEDR